MTGINEVLQESIAPIEVLAPTGLCLLDSIVGGVRRGEVWILTGAPRQGRSMFVTQMARLAAETGHVTQVWAGSDPVSYYAQLIVSATLQTPLHGVQNGWMHPRVTDPVERLAALGVLPLSIRLVGSSWASSPFDARSAPTSKGMPPPYETRLGPAPDVVVVDDVDLHVTSEQSLPELIGTLRSKDSAVLVTVPKALVNRERPDWQAWVRCADMILQVETSADVWVREGLISLLSNRRGPDNGTFETVADLLHAQFVEPLHPWPRQVAESGESDETDEPQDDGLEPISELNRADVEAALKAVLPLAQDSSVTALARVSLWLAEGALHLGVTDEHTIVIVCLPAPHDSTSEFARFTVDGDELLSFLHHRLLGRDVELLRDSGRLVVRETSEFREWSRGETTLLEDASPDLSAQIPAAPSTQATVLRASLADAIPEVEYVDLAVGRDSLVIGGDSTGPLRLDAEVTGPAVDTRLPTGALRHVLAASFGGVVQLGFNSRTDAVVVRCTAGEGSSPPASLIAAIMPVLESAHPGRET